MLAACGSQGSPGNTSSPGAPACSPQPCGASHGVTVTISDLDAWYGWRLSGMVGGPQFSWRIHNGTNATLTLDQSAIDTFDSNHAEIRSDTDPANTTGDGVLPETGCTPRQTMRIPPHQTVSVQRVCVQTTNAAQAGVLEFALTSGPVDVPLSAYDTTSGACPPDADIINAIKYMGFSVSQVHQRYCKSAVVAVTADTPSSYLPGSASTTRGFLVVRQSGGTLQLKDADLCHSSYVPSSFRQHLGC